MSVREAMLSISDEELKGWMAYNRIHPISRERFDYLNAMQCYFLIKVNSKPNAKIDLADFMPDWNGEKSKPRTSDEIEKSLTGFIKAHNNKIKVQKVRAH